MSGRVLSWGTDPHRCDPPYDRKTRKALRDGAIWQCDCGTKWRWGQGYDMLQWSRVVDWSKVKVPTGPAPGATTSCPDLAGDPDA